MKQIIDLGLPSPLTIKLVAGGITTTGLLRVLTTKNLCHNFNINTKTLDRINLALTRHGEEPLDLL